ncbi:hypothetical protein N8596_00735, partial [bacterium]|nr:hypothetical protein [bacterium]
FSVDGLFPDETRPPEAPVFADWYSGELRIPEGDMIQYVHGGYGTTYERDRLILIERGRFVRSWVRKNDPPPESRGTTAGVQGATGVAAKVAGET